MSYQALLEVVIAALQRNQGLVMNLRPFVVWVGQAFALVPGGHQEYLWCWVVLEARGHLQTDRLEVPLWEVQLEAD